MPPLRKLLSHPGTYLAVLVLVVGTAGADSYRSPDRQMTAKAYLGLVHIYQARISPVLSERLVRCRFRPTCSHYSEEAVRRHGIRKGMILTVRRVWRCRRNVPLGTEDPLPADPMPDAVSQSAPLAAEATLAS